MSKLTETAEEKWDEKLHSVDERLKKATRQTEALLPNIAQLKIGILNLESVFATQVSEAIKVRRVCFASAADS